MQLAAVNNLNIGLMLASLAIAFVVPFELFLFSYAVLGPLHYLTELSWLRDRRCFAPGRLDWLPLALLGLLVVVATRRILPPGLSVPALASWGPEVLFIAFLAALVFVLSPRWLVRLPALAAIGLAAKFLHRDELRLDEPYVAIFAVFLPTLVHVFVFTGAFILFGALKARSGTGYISFVVFLACAALAVTVPVSPDVRVAAKWVRQTYMATFEPLHQALSLNFGDGDLLKRREIFRADFGIRLMRFIAFAYTYHFLNWFSKTSIIRWHEVAHARFALVIGLWLLSVAAYAQDYETGFRWVYGLSIIHVVLEFPLNHRSFIGIGEQIRLRLGRAT